MQHSEINIQNIHLLQFISLRLHFSCLSLSLWLHWIFAIRRGNADPSIQRTCVSLPDPDRYYLCTLQEVEVSVELSGGLECDATLHIRCCFFWLSTRVHGSRGCFGCCNKTPLITTVDEQSKGLRLKGRTVKNLDEAEDLGSSSTGDMDSNAVPSHVSASSISTSTQPLDPHSSSSTASQPPEYVNHGLLLWNQIRQQWIGTKKTPKETRVRESRISWNATYESLLGTSKPFPQPIPLPEMIDFLVEVWEQEGLYD